MKHILSFFNWLLNMPVSGCVFGGILLSVFIIAVHGAFAAKVKLIWDPPDFGEPDGYKIYYGNASRAYVQDVDVGAPTNCTITGLEEGKTYYFAATAYYPDGAESGFSNEAVKFIPKADTDGDGIPDTDEIEVFGTDPNRADSDGDGLSDGAEINTHNTNPNLADTDSDGMKLFFWGGAWDSDNDGDGLINLQHVANSPIWETEICIINTETELSLTGVLKAHSNAGREVYSTLITLPPNARREISIGDELPNPSGVGYIIFESESENVRGYTKFYAEGRCRAAVPATPDVNSGDIHIPHIASGPEWWTGISIINTTSTNKNISIEFNNGSRKTISIAAKAHKVFTIANLFGGVAQPTIRSGVIKNGSGIIGLELFGSTASSGKSYLSGVLLEDDTATEIFYPHVVNSAIWWTGIVAYNPFNVSSDIMVTPFKNDGTSLSPQTITLAPHEKYVGTAAQLNFPDGTAWFKIDATSPITGFELFGSNNGKQLGGYTGVGISRTEGVFAKIEKDGWTGISFVNIESSPSIVTITAHNDDGNVIATETLNLAGYEKVLGVAPDLFSQDIGSATYISYSSNGEIVGFQLNGSSDGMMLDGLPGM